MQALARTLGQRLQTRPAFAFERLAIVSAAIVVAVLVGYPIVSAFGAFRPQALSQLAGQEQLVPLGNSLLLAVLTVIPATAIAVPLAWLCARTDLPGRRVIVLLVSISFVLPILLSAIAYVFLFGRNAGLVNTWFSGMLGGPLYNIYSFSGVVLVSVLHAFPLVYFTTLAGISNVNPELEEAGRICGLSPVQVFVRITAGAITPSIMAGVAFAVAETLTTLSGPLVLGLPVGIRFVTTELYSSVVMTPNLSGALVTSLPLVGATLIVLALQAWIVGDAGSSRFSTVSGKGVRAEIVRLGRWKPLAVAFAWMPILLALIVPVLTLLAAALMQHWWKGLSIENLTLANFVFLFHDEATRLAMRNSVLVGLGVAAVLTVAGGILAILLAGEQTLLKRAVRNLCMVPLGLPHVVAGLLVILAWYGPPFNLGGTIWIVALGYGLVLLSYAVKTGEAARGQIDRSLGEAAQVIGCSPLQAWWHVVLPLMRQGLVTIFLLVFLFAIKEFPLTAMVYTADTLTLAVRIYGFLEGGSYEKTAAASMVLLALTFLSLVVAAKVFGLKASSLRV